MLSAGPSGSSSIMPSTRSVCLGILVASCLAIFFYRNDMLIRSRDSLHMRTQGHLSMRVLMKEHGARTHALRPRKHAGDASALCRC